MEGGALPLGVLDTDVVMEGERVCVGETVDDTEGEVVEEGVAEGVAGAEGVTEGVGVCEGEQRTETMVALPSQPEHVHTRPHSSRVQQGLGASSSSSLRRASLMLLPPPPPPLDSW